MNSEILPQNRSKLSIEDLQCQWVSGLRVPQEGSKPFTLLSVCGPSGSGKTTVCRSLADTWPAYLEDVEGNPYLQKLLERSSEFDAAGNQKWFLDRIGRFVKAAPAGPVVLDQDPSAIVLAYSRMFFDVGKITECQYNSLLEELLHIEQVLLRWKVPRTVLCLDAPAEVLQQRVVQRWGITHTPPLAWFVRVRSHFLDLFSRFPNAIKVSTVELSVEKVVSLAKHLLKDDREGAQAWPS